MYILILMMHVGMMADDNSNALSSIGGFESQQACIKAGNAAVQMAAATLKEIKFVCASSK